MEPTFTLKQLALFDRCLFPDDIAEEIGKEAGYDEAEILLLKMELRRQVKDCPLSVVGLFQDRINDEKFCAALTKVLISFTTSTLKQEQEDIV